MNKHTPGPWSIHKQANTAVVGSTGFVVAACGGYSSNDRDPDDLATELSANARLIAAAPELLSALRAMLTHMGMDEDEWNKSTFDQARAAIKKATGE